MRSNRSRHLGSMSTVSTVERQLTAASNLIQGLSSEQVRWAEEKSKLQEMGHRAVGDSLLAASFLSYLGAFTFGYRQEMLDNVWAVDLTERSMPMTVPLSVVNI